jgi:hypothetical protein
LGDSYNIDAAVESTTIRQPLFSRRWRMFGRPRRSSVE